MAMLSRFNKNAMILTSGATKSNILEIYNQATFQIQNKSYECGAVAVWMASSMQTQRDTVDSDSTMRFLSGMISRDQSKHPVWETALRAAIPATCAVSYETPGSNSNFTAWKCV